MNFDISKFIDGIKAFNKPLVFIVFGLLTYYIHPFAILGLTLDWIPKVKLIGFVSLCIGAALTAQRLWELFQDSYQQKNKKKSITLALLRLNEDEKKILQNMWEKKIQSCPAPKYHTAYFSLEAKGIAWFGDKSVERYLDFHLTETAWEILEINFEKIFGV